MAIKQFRYFIPVAAFCFLLQIVTLRAGDVSRTYTWAYDRKIYTIQHDYHENTYDYYKKLRRTYSNFLTYLDESSYFPVIESFANEFKIIAAKNHFSDWQTVECVITFIQSFEYISDGTYEYPKFPIETLIDEGGDCEDSAILLAAILRQLGFNSVLVSPLNHMGVGIALDTEIEGTAFEFSGQKYYYIETTSMGWCIGDYPEHLSDEATIYDPGQLGIAKLLSADNFSFTESATYASNEYDEPSVNASNDNESSNYKYTPNKNNISTNTIDVDEIVIDGEKQTVITKQVGADVIATEE